MSQRKPLSPEAKEAVNQVIRKFCEDVERRKIHSRLPCRSIFRHRNSDNGTSSVTYRLVGVLAELNEQPREA